MPRRKTTGLRPGLMLLFTLLLLAALVAIVPPAVTAAPTTSITIKKLASDGSTVLAEKTVDYRWLMNPENIPVLGDGVTHYYHQGPVFIDHPDAATEEALRWNPEEDTNIETKDMGALKGTNVKDLCELVGGMTAGDKLKIKASDGLTRTFAYKNVYQYSNREGPMVICWYRNGQYPDSGFSDGMRLVWFADNSTNPWGKHVFGNWDWHEAAESEYWYYFHSGNEKYPTTTGLSIQSVAELIICSNQPAPEAPAVPVAQFTANTVSGPAPLTVKFADRSANSPATWAWDFDNDGKTDSDTRNPSHTYSEPGTYTVRLVVSNAAGSDEEVKTDYIRVSPAVEAPPDQGTEGQVEPTPETPEGQSETVPAVTTEPPAKQRPFLQAAPALVIGVVAIALLATVLALALRKTKKK